MTVIEWGRDKAEHLSDSRLELDFTRLTGADARFAYSAAEEFSWDDEDKDESDEDADTPNLVAAGARLRPPAGSMLSTL